MPVLAVSHCFLTFDQKYQSVILHKDNSLGFGSHFVQNWHIRKVKYTTSRLKTDLPIE
jgi:hypothetical protein